MLRVTKERVVCYVKNTGRVKDSSLVGVIYQLRHQGGVFPDQQFQGREDRGYSRQRAQPGQGRTEHGPGQEWGEALGGDLRDGPHWMGACPLGHPFTVTSLMRGWDSVPPSLRQ